MHADVWHDTINGVNCSTETIHALDNFMGKLMFLGLQNSSWNCVAAFNNVSFGLYSVNPLLTDTNKYILQLIFN